MINIKRHNPHTHKKTLKFSIIFWYKGVKRTIILRAIGLQNKIQNL